MLIFTNVTKCYRNLYSVAITFTFCRETALCYRKRMHIFLPLGFTYYKIVRFVIC